MTQNKSLCMLSSELEVYIKLLNELNRALYTLDAYHSQFSHILPDEFESHELEAVITDDIEFYTNRRKFISEYRKKVLSNELKQIF